MKAQIESSAHGNVMSLRTTQDGKVHKAKHHHKEEENEEIKAYLTKLQELVPFMPKNKKLSKLEVITCVIEYIRDLRTTLGLPPQNSRLNSSSASLPSSRDFMEDPLEMMSQANLSLSLINTSSSASLLSSPTSSSSLPHSNHHNHHRQPLVVISTPNNSSLNGSCASQEIPQLMDKSPTADVDTRPVSC